MRRLRKQNTSTSKTSIGTCVVLLSILVFGFLFARTACADSDSLRIHFIDVGYGDAILVEFPDASTLLIDAGENSSGKDLAQYILSLGFSHIQTAIITHPHQNHFGGFIPILRRLSIGRVYINGDMHSEKGYTELLHQFSQNKIPFSTLKEEDILPGGNNQIELRILNPKELSGSPNDNSLAIWIRYKHTSFFLTADIGIERQKAVLKKFPFLRKAKCIQIPHHGDCLSDDFIKVFKDKIFIVSTGKNKAGLPCEEDLDKLSGKVLRTDRDGTIILESDGQKVTIIRPPHE